MMGRLVELTPIQSPSPNFDDRTLPISILVLHYTGMESGKAALERLKDPKAKVSAHYLIEEDGTLYMLVDEEKRAWHAGVAEWGGLQNVNSASIGIEIVNGGHNVPLADGSLPPYPDAQINALVPLCKNIVNRYNIRAHQVVGHSDVAPDRKNDPGEHFPWAGLAAAGIGLWPGEGNGDDRVLFEPGDRDRGVSILQFGLAQIGYAIEVNGIVDDRTVSVVTAFQRRFRQNAVNGIVDVETFDLIARVTRLL